MPSPTYYLLTTEEILRERQINASKKGALETPHKISLETHLKLFVEITSSWN